MDDTLRGWTDFPPDSGRLRDQPLLPLPPVWCAGEAGSLSTAIQTTLPDGQCRSPKGGYLDAVLARYLWLPDTPAVVSRHDRRLAALLYQRGVSLLAVEAALLLASTRRALREPWRNPLPRIRALAYFVPTIDEVLAIGREPDLEYLTCLLRRLRPLAEIKAMRQTSDSDRRRVSPRGGAR